jgi:hypothetical protein
MIPIAVERLAHLYDNVKVRSLRLETRQTYHVPWEDEGRAAWRRGDAEAPFEPSLESFRGRLAARRERGQRTLRVRFVELPMTEYSAQEFAWGYPGNTAAGEEIHVVDRADHPEFDHVVEDFVVFDDTALMYYRYTPDDQLTGYEFSDDATLVADHLELAEEVLSVAIPFPQWAREHR